ncbi:MAG: Flp pilus assembly protein CpaB [Verrucomicrobia bacterium]|nr:Flp pilus assembly protein CpaB [Verrucomicrobiota bacterium]
MSRPGSIFVIAAILLGGLTAYAVYDYIQRSSTAQAGPQPVSIFVALADIPSRQEVKTEMIGTRKVPPHDVIPGTAAKLDEIVGKITLTPIKAYEQFRLKDLALKNKVPGLSYVIPAGMRAITLGISDTRGVSGAIFPGDHVDILCSLRDPSRGQSVVQVPLQNLLVLAVDSAKTETETGAKQSLTLCVKPEEAQVLTAAEEVGGHAIRVILRSKDDQTIMDDRAVSLDKYLKGAPKTGEEAKAEELALPVAPQKKLKIYDGGKVNEFPVP